MSLTVEEFRKRVLPVKEQLRKGMVSKKPSIYTLSAAGRTLLDLTEELKSEDEGDSSRFQFIILNLKIYLADLGGKLQHDYDKNNKRYKDKWESERKKLVDIIGQLQQKITEN